MSATELARSIGTRGPRPMTAEENRRNVAELLQQFLSAVRRNEGLTHVEMDQARGKELQRP